MRREPFEDPFGDPASIPATRAAMASGVSTKSVPASGISVIIEDSSVSARMSSGSRWCTSLCPQARATICISMVIDARKLNTRSAAASTSSRFISSGSWVVIPTGHRPVWQWWQAPGSTPSLR